MTTYSVGAKVFCDFHFSGKPEGIVTEIIQSGTGKNGRGKVKVKITKEQGAYKKGEILEVDSFTAVPCKQEFRKPNSIYRWVNTDYQFIP